MPSVSVPLKGDKGWSVLMTQRRQFWAKDSNNLLSKNFKATEFYCHDGSAVPIVSRAALVNLCQDFLEPLRMKFGTCIILSGYRHTLYNSGIGGALFSQHIYEHNFESVAADIRFNRGNPSLWGTEAKLCRIRNNSGNGGVGIYTRDGFIHVDNRTYKADWNQ